MTHTPPPHRARSWPGPVAIRTATGCAVLALAALWVSNCRLNRLVSRSPSDGGLQVAPAQIQDSAIAGSRSPRRVTVLVSGDGAWRATKENPWIDLDPTTGGARSLLTISLDPEHLSPGYHLGVVRVTAEGAPPVEIAVTFFIQQPVLEVFPDEFNYNTRFDRLFLDSVRIRNEGTGPLVWTAHIATDDDDDDDDEDNDDDDRWLVLGSLSGSGNGNIPIRVDSDEVREGTHRRTIIISAPGAKGSPAQVKVTLRRRHD